MGSNISVLKDSFSEWQYTLSVSSNMRFRLNQELSLSLGVAGYVMYKKDNYKNNVSKEKAEYDFIGGLAPLGSLYYNDFSVNFAYVPSFSYKELEVVGFAIVYFGYRF
jgi:hypothetical protein